MMPGTLVTDGTRTGIVTGDIHKAGASIGLVTVWWINAPWDVYVMPENLRVVDVYHRYPA